MTFGLFICVHLCNLRLNILSLRVLGEVPELRLGQTDYAEAYRSSRKHSLFPAAGQRGRSPEHAVARVVPVGSADDLTSYAME
jgi:hypothetical protein